MTPDNLAVAVGEKVGVIGFSSCLMQMAEVGFSFVSSQYVVATENSQLWWSHVAPFLSAVVFADNEGTYVAPYDLAQMIYETAGPTTYFSVTHGGGEGLPSAMRDVAVEYGSAGYDDPEVKNCLMAALGVTQQIDPNYYYADVTALTDKLHTYCSQHETVDDVQLATMTDQLISEVQLGLQQAVASGGWQDNYTLPGTGITIFVPRMEPASGLNRTLWINSMNNYSLTNFGSSTGWAGLLTWIWSSSGDDDDDDDDGSPN